jgi:hypothetical protein
MRPHLIKVTQSSFIPSFMLEESAKESNPKRAKDTDGNATAPLVGSCCSSSSHPHVELHHLGDHLLPFLVFLLFLVVLVILVLSN